MSNLVRPVEVAPFRAIPISSSLLMEVLYKIDPFNRNHSEISSAIADAANQDPLFPHREDGCLRTACILLAIAFSSSRLSTNLIGNNGSTFGLYQIHPPKTDVNGKVITVNLLNSARDASLIAIDLIRTSMLRCKDKPWAERLSVFALNGDESANEITIFQSMERMALADRFLSENSGKLGVARQLKA